MPEDDIAEFPSKELDNLLDGFIRKHFPGARIAGVLVMAKGKTIMTSQFSYGAGNPLSNEAAVSLLEAAKGCIVEPDQQMPPTVIDPNGGTKH